MISFQQSRREFLGSCLGLAASSIGAVGGGQNDARAKLKAVVIGHTGHGDYGHEHDLIFRGRDNIEVVAVADSDAAGRAKAVARLQVPRGYADYREMLEKERPQLVSVALRCADEHHAMALAALKAGAHVYIEKPITQTLVEADELLAVAKKRGLKIAVPHQMRLAPNILLLSQQLENIIGDLLEIRAQGKQDRRAGGEDLVVLGVHLFDLMRLFAGEPRWCSARILQNGREITSKDAHAATESIGPVAGDDIIAQFDFAKGVHGSFISRAKSQAAAGPYGLELIGSKSSVRIVAGIVPKIYTRQNASWTPNGNVAEWKIWEQDPTREIDSSGHSVALANQRVVNDWLDAIARNREPICSGEAATKALEMVMAVFSAGLARGRVALPLEDRQHPLAGR